MKKNKIRFLCLFLVSVNFLVSCAGSGTEKQSKVSATPWETTKETENTGGDVTSISADDAFTRAEQILKDMSLDEKIGQLFIVNLELLDTSKGSYYNFTKINKKIKQAMTMYPVGGVILQSKNIETPEQLKKLISDLQAASPHTPLYIATEEAGGTNSIFAGNSNLRGTVFPSYYELGHNKSMEEIEQIGTTVGNELKDFGFNLNLAPTADVGDEEKNPSYVSQCFSTEADKVESCVSSIITGMDNAGMGTVLRTFPGLGSVQGKIGQELVNNDNSLTHMREVDFLPFQAGIDAGADCIMVSNTAVSKITQNTAPASMSELIIEGIIREELGFEGVVMTDSMNCPVITENYSADEAALQVLVAGVDVILMPENLDTAFQGIKKAVINQSLDMRVLNAAVLRILQNKIQQGIITLDESDAP